VNSASSNKTMITHRAKLRKFAFIQQPSRCEAQAINSSFTRPPRDPSDPM
jgi:hypothetical protein